jgi:tRNA dimethylallyltransferase
VTSVLVIAGPTASGKTRLAIEVAERLGGEIVSADSQQVYRGLDVGTAKPTAEERRRVPHHLLDLVEPTGRMDAARFAALADETIAAISGRGRVPVVAGGTGLYLRALLHGVVEAPGRNEPLRAQLEELARVEGRQALHRRLQEVDPEAAARIGENDLVRVIRALEIAQGGTRQSALFAAHRFRPQRYQTLFVAIDFPREELHRRIDERVEAMFAGGILAEARTLLALAPGAPLKLPIGYREALEHLRGEIDLAEAIRRTRVATRRYARRQITWLRGEPGVEWLPAPIAPEALAARFASVYHRPH